MRDGGSGGTPGGGVGGVHSTGVGILFKGWDYHCLEGFSVVQGRVLGVDFEWRGQKLRVLNTYAPAAPGGRREVFEELRAVCLTNRILVFGGGF